MKRIRSLMMAAVALAGVTLLTVPSANAGGVGVSINIGSSPAYYGPGYYTRGYYSRPVYYQPVRNYGYYQQPNGYYNRRANVYRSPAYRSPVYRSPVYYNHR